MTRIPQDKMQDYSPEDAYLVDSYASRDFVLYVGCIEYPTDESRVARWEFSLGVDETRAVLSYDLDRGLEVALVDLANLRIRESSRARPRFATYWPRCSRRIRFSS